MSLSTPAEEYNRTISVLFTSLLSPTGRSDNDGSLLVSAYRGIGSETVRCPVVVTGHDPNKVITGLSAPYRKSHPEVPLATAYGCFRLSTTRKSVMAKDLRGFWKPPLGSEQARKAEAKFVRARIKRRKKTKPQREPKVQKADRFYESLNWRQIRMVVLKNCDGRCMCCGASAKDGIRIHVDHIKPRSTHPHLELDLNNLQVLCEDCNLGKGGWDDTDWRVKM